MTPHANGSAEAAVTKGGGRLATLAARMFSPAGRKGRLAVFTYHQVLEKRDELRPNEPDRAEFARDLELIARVFSVLPLPDAVRQLAAGTLPARAATITFDDGYANNHSLAAPLLESYGLPATFFITCGAVDEGIMWNDLLIEAVARGRRPLSFDALDEGVRAPLGSLEGAQLVRALLSALKYTPLERRLAVVQEFYAHNVDAAAPRLMMSRGEVADLHRRGFDVGGHTMKHPILKALETADARNEIESCSTWIRDVTGRRPVSFAYPNGRPDVDFTQRDAELVASAGYETAVSTKWRLATAGADPFSIPRVGPWWRHGHTLTGGMIRLQLSASLAR
jgi:peptidoglycan/xylan/chitin deacetylase (PgdA/CDA1 family)